MSNPVVVGVAASQSSLEAVEWASDEAWLRDAPLRLVHAWFGEAAHAPAGQETRLSKDAGAGLLEAARDRALVRRPGLAVATELVNDHPRQALAAAADGALLVVVGTRGSGGFPRLLLGSTSLQTAAHAACPVVVVRPREAEAGAGAEAGTGGGVLVGVRGRGRDDEVLAYAFDTARRRDLPLHAVHAWAYPLVTGPDHDLPLVYEEADIADEHERLLAEVLAGRRAEYPEVTVTTTAVRSNAARELVAGSQSHQLVVVGRHGEPHGPLGRLGSTSQAVVQHAGCPVVVVPV
ncbi:universal stress protein [Kitasatospora sp. NPDC059327]|uniref:universal stress protein n=1 Tax=Kitasatospora sp. NPDC059327 TaxID=3346803 RepID=UPI00369ED1AA